LLLGAPFHARVTPNSTRQLIWIARPPAALGADAPRHATTAVPSPFPERGKHASPRAARGPYCGDGVQQAGEACDDGQNLSGYGSGCAPGCALPARCGDGKIDGLFGETCDDGVNDGSYSSCTSTCQRAARCGDGQRQGAEQCDDGNLLSGDGCSSSCAFERIR
jgi:cysteine-rich repeat protein